MAQSPTGERKTLTLEEAVDLALKNYPAVRAALERVNAAKAGVGLARTNYLPRAGLEMKSYATLQMRFGRRSS